MKKFRISNINYAPLGENGAYVKIGDVENPWAVECPNGHMFFERTHRDAIYRMTLEIARDYFNSDIHNTLEGRL